MFDLTANSDENDEGTRNSKDRCANLRKGVVNRACNSLLLFRRRYRSNTGKPVSSARHSAVVAARTTERSSARSLPLIRSMSGKYETDSRDLRPLTPRKSKKPPFKLCFARNQQTGRSNTRASTMNADFITPKFYTRECEEARNANLTDTTEKIAVPEERKDRTKDFYRSPLLTSQTYGWWHGNGTLRIEDPRFNFHKKTSDLVSFQMKIYAEDRKLLKGRKQRMERELFQQT